MLRAKKKEKKNDYYFMLSVDFVLSISHSLSLHTAVRHNYSSVETHKKLYNEETPGAYSSLRDESVCFFFV